MNMNSFELLLVALLIIWNWNCRAVGEDVVYVVLLVIFVALVLEWMIFYSLIFHVI